MPPQLHFDPTFSREGGVKNEEGAEREEREPTDEENTARDEEHSSDDDSSDDDSDDDEELFTFPWNAKPIFFEEFVPPEPVRSPSNREQKKTEQQHTQNKLDIIEDQVDYTAFEHKSHRPRNQHVLGLKFVHDGQARGNGKIAGKREVVKRPGHIDRVFGSVVTTLQGTGPPPEFSDQQGSVASRTYEETTKFSSFEHLRLQRVGEG
jgi:hypothetical protein